jgi:hypothetical protein
MHSSARPRSFAASVPGLTMSLSEAATELLRAVLADRENLLDRATDKVFFGSPDLAGKRPRLVTRMLVDRVFACSELSLLTGDDSEFDLFIDQVTGMRAESDYHVSTMLSGIYSFRFAIEEPCRLLATDGWVAVELLTAVDALYMRTGPRSAALLIERQEAVMRERAAVVERQNTRLMEQHRSSGEALRTVRAEHQASTAALARRKLELEEKKATLEALERREREAHR